MQNVLKVTVRMVMVKTKKRMANIQEIGLRENKLAKEPMNGLVEASMMVDG